MDKKHISLQILQDFATKFKAKIDTLLNNKVDKVSGKQLSTNDYTTAEKQKLAGLDNYTLPKATNSTLGGIKVGAGLTIDGEGNLSATGGGEADSVNWDNVVGKPTKLSQFTNDSGFQNSTQVGAIIDGKIAGKADKTTTINGKPLSNNVTLGATDVQAIPALQKGTANGVATLGTDGKVPAAQLPSYVDDIIDGYLHTDGKFYKEAAHTTAIVGESGKVYVDLTTNKTYRWSSTTFVPIGSDLALGETASTAYAGNKGKANADEIAKIKNGTTVVPKAAQANNATTVNGHTVEVNVPANAKFTDTVYTPNFATTGDIDNIITEVFG